MTIYQPIRPIGQTTLRCNDEADRRKFPSWPADHLPTNRTDLFPMQGRVGSKKVSMYSRLLSIGSASRMPTGQTSSRCKDESDCSPMTIYRPIGRTSSRCNVESDRRNFLAISRLLSIGEGGRMSHPNRGHGLRQQKFYVGASPTHTKSQFS